MREMPMARAARARRPRRWAGSSSSTRSEPSRPYARRAPSGWNQRSGSGVVSPAESLARATTFQENTMRLLTTLALGMALGLALATTAFAQGTGRSLDIQPGARHNGMGATGVAIADDATGVTWWNPAGLGCVTRSAIDLTYAQLVPGLATDVNYNYARSEERR